MSWSFQERRRRERNYRFMFKAALGCCIVGLLVTIAGSVYAWMESDPMWITLGLFMVIYGIGSAWLTVDSTVKIIELDIEDGADVRHK